MKSKPSDYDFAGDFMAVVTDIDAGGGAIIDLMFSPNLKLVREIKYSPSGEITQVDMPYDTFNPRSYGFHGQIFMDRVDEILGIDEFGFGG